jgi:hypothetical protein
MTFRSKNFAFATPAMLPNLVGVPKMNAFVIHLQKRGPNYLSATPFLLGLYFALGPGN